MIRIENLARLKHVPPQVQDLFPHIISSYESNYHCISEIRLIGSLVRGDFIEGVSDIDVLCILKGDSPCSKNAAIRESESFLQDAYPAAPKFDLDVCNEAFIESNFDYKLLIMTDSVSIFGSNTYWVEHYDIEEDELAALWNPDPFELFETYAAQIRADQDSSITDECAWLLGKDLIKSYRPKLMREHSCFDRSIRGSVTQLKQHYPRFAQLFDTLFELYSLPASRANIHTRLMDIQRLNRQFCNEVHAEEMTSEQVLTAQMPLQTPVGYLDIIREGELVVWHKLMTDPQNAAPYAHNGIIELSKLQSIYHQCRFINDDKGSHYFLFKEPRELLGCVTVKKATKTVYEIGFRLFLHEQRHKHIMSGLFPYFIDYLKTSRKPTGLVAYTDERNVASQKLLLKYGFQQTAGTADHDAVAEKTADTFDSHELPDKNAIEFYLCMS